MWSIGGCLSHEWNSHTHWVSYLSKTLQELVNIIFCMAVIFITCISYSFCKNVLGDSGVKALADGLMKNPACILKHLGWVDERKYFICCKKYNLFRFFGCSITDEGVKSVCQLTETNRLSGVQCVLCLNGIVVLMYIPHPAQAGLQPWYHWCRCADVSQSTQVKHFIETTEVRPRPYEEGLYLGLWEIAQPHNLR